MHCRFFFIFILFLNADLALADSGAWNCEKVEGSEWTCSAQDSQPKIGKPKPVQLEPSIAKPKALPAPVKVPPVYLQPPRTVAKRPGWTCSSVEEDDTWNCSLFGADPKGKAKVVESDEESSGIIASAFDFKQEQIFEALHAQLKYDPWENCTSSVRTEHQYVPGKDLRSTMPMDVTADYSEIFDKEITSFYGNVEITRADQKVLSDMVNYDTVSETMDAQGHVFYSEDELSLYSDTALLKLGTDEARLRNALFISPAGPIRGDADVVYRDSKDLSRYKEVAFTSCPPGNQDWVIHADRLKMNQRTGRASAKHAWMEFKGLPVFYTPYISFPLDDRRISGFLTPSFGESDDTGFDMTVPYYWNIAPNYDLTIKPRYMSKRGGMIGGEFRYLTEKTQGTIAAEVLPYDSKRQEARYAGTFKSTSRFTPRITANTDLNYVSDDDYIEELKSSLGLSYDSYVRSSADINYRRQGVNFSTRVQSFQTIDQNIADTDKPYQQLPQMTLNLNHSFEQWPIDIGMENEYVFFYRSNHDGRPTGHRMNTRPSIEFPVETPGAFLKPKVSVQYTQYELSDQPLGHSESISRVLPIFSTDSGLIFEKNMKLGESKYIHTIEPRLFYLYIPKDDQQDIPDFDTALFDFNFNSLFRENRFSGSDKIQDANQITAAISTRLIDSERGQERLKLSLGQIFYFRDREVTLQGDRKETDSLSNLVTELSGRLTDNISFSSGMQFNYDLGEVTRGNAEIRYRDRPGGRLINLGYRYRKDDLTEDSSIHQSDTSIRWPIYDNWYGVARLQYSFRYSSTKESFLGLEKESCCWRFRVLWRRYTDTLNNDISDIQLEQGLFVQLELKGLSSFGDKLDEFLEENLKGYQRPE
jgi:LPS-assembly protein